MCKLYPVVTPSSPRRHRGAQALGTMIWQESSSARAAVPIPKELVKVVARLIRRVVCDNDQLLPSRCCSPWRVQSEKASVDACWRTCVSIHAYVCSSPLLKGCDGAQLSFSRMRLLFEFRPRTPTVPET